MKKSTLEEKTQPDAVTSPKEQQKAERAEKMAENVRYGQTISEGGMGDKATKDGGSTNQGKGGLYVIFYNDNEDAEACLQTGLEQQMHRDK